jgi:hypothetical protein
MLLTLIKQLNLLSTSSMSTIKTLEARIEALEARWAEYDANLQTGGSKKTTKKASTRTPGLTSSLRMYIESRKKELDYNEAKASWKDLSDAVKEHWKTKAKEYNENIKKNALVCDNSDNTHGSDDAPKAGRKAKKEPVDSDDSPKPKAGRKKKEPVANDDSDDSPKPKASRKAKKEPVDSDDSPKPKAGRKAKKVATATEDSDEVPKPKAGRKASAKKPVIADSDDDDVPVKKEASSQSDEKLAPKKRAPGNKSKGAIKLAALSDDD